MFLYNLIVFCTFEYISNIHLARGKKFPQSWVFNILKRESTIPPNEEIIKHNVCNVELQPTICDV